MTTELRQAITLLQYSTLDLAKYIYEQALENPLIELEKQTSEMHIEEQYVEYSGPNSYQSSDNIDPIDFIASNDTSRFHDLLEQIKFLPINEQTYNILEYMILNLDNNGYLTLEESEISEQLSVPIQAVQTAITQLHQLEPIGVGARNIQECLLIQAKYYFPSDQLITQIIKDYLDLLANKKWQEITEKLNISMEDLKRINEKIVSLHPRPYSDITNLTLEILYPDVTVKKINGDYAITFHDQYVPKIKLNQGYLDLQHTNSQAASYVKDHFQSYKWLLRSIEQRRATIINITKAIVQQQQDFLENGFAYLKPMTLKEIADQIGMHESTISRATSNKVICTPHGSFEMRKLFTSRLSVDNNTNVSSAQVKQLLQQLIAAEDPRRPLSDQKLAEHFKREKGITISRRTIAKYRDELNILSSSKRKII